jgi:tetratricopeptide (TPR) repeat protein
MAQRDLAERFFSKEFTLDPRETFLPGFPSYRELSEALPEMAHGNRLLGKIQFVPWVDFVLENPDEIWEGHDDDEKTYYYYFYFINEECFAPAFVVEISCVDDFWKINNFSLLLGQPDLAEIRKGHRVYCRSKEWDRENFIRILNDEALQKYDQNRLDEAKELIDTAIRFSGSGSAYLFNNRGLICWKMGRTGQAKKDFMESINLDSANGDPYFNIGLIYFDESDYGNALRFLKRAVEINPVDSQFLTELGHLYLEMEEEEEALKLFERAFENDPSDPQVDFHLGYYFLYKKRSPKSAVKYYRQGLKKDPEDQFALADLAIAHWVIGNHRKTLQIHKALQRKPRLMPYTISRLVYLNMEMGNYEAALNYYREALNNGDPFEPEWLHYNAALVYIKTGRAKQALDILDLAVKMGGEAVIRRALSEKALEELKGTPDFKKLIRLPTKRKNR